MQKTRKTWTIRLESTDKLESIANYTIVVQPINRAKPRLSGSLRGGKQEGARKELGKSARNEGFSGASRISTGDGEKSTRREPTSHDPRHQRRRRGLQSSFSQLTHGGGDGKSARNPCTPKGLGVRKKQGGGRRPEAERRPAQQTQLTVAGQQRKIGIRN